MAKHPRSLVVGVVVWGSLAVGAGIGQHVATAAAPPGALQTGDAPARVAADDDQQEPPITLTRSVLDRSLELGRQYLINSQLPSGIFRYEVHFVTGAREPKQGPVRQSGALWGLALIHHDQPSDETRRAVLRGIAFYTKHSHATEDGRRFIRFPGRADGDSGGVALVALALIDFLRAEPADQHPALKRQLDEYLAFLESLERTDHGFYPKYLLGSGEGWGRASPYFDGEILLALVKAARYLGYAHLRATCLRVADAAFERHAERSLRESKDPPETKGFFQWACMAYQELHASQWPGTGKYGPRTIRLAHWMIDVHRTLQRRRNTAYAHEGIIAAYHVARQLGDDAAAAKFRRTVESGLGKLVTWQVGGPSPNAFLRRHTDYDKRCTGGILSAPDSPLLRIDTTQHQMHAVILARRYIWTRSRQRG